MKGVWVKFGNFTVETIFVQNNEVPLELEQPFEEVYVWLGLCLIKVETLESM